MDDGLSVILLVILTTWLLAAGLDVLVSLVSSIFTDSEVYEGEHLWYD